MTLMRRARMLRCANCMRRQGYAAPSWDLAFGRGGHTWQWEDRWVESDEWFYLLRVPTFESAPAAPDQWETEYMHEQRWWGMSELIANKSTETFVPSGLPELLPPILVGDIPAQPIEVGA